MGYYVGDVPAQPLVIEPARAGEAIDLAPFTDVIVAAYGPDGVELVTPGFLATIEGDVVVVDWPESSPFADAGIYDIRLTLDNPTTNARERLAPVRVVADVDDGWYTLDLAREDWRDAPSYDASLYQYLWTARNDVLEYAPALADGARPPLNYRQAQLMQARNRWNAARVDPSNGSLGEDTFIVRPFPLDWAIKQLLRPKSAVPRIG